MNFGRTEPIVRINSISSGLAEEDLKVILQATHLPPTIMLPKVEQTSEFEWVMLMSNFFFKSFHESFSMIYFCDCFVRD